MRRGQPSSAVLTRPFSVSLSLQAHARATKTNSKPAPSALRSRDAPQPEVRTSFYWSDTLPDDPSARTAAIAAAAPPLSDRKLRTLIKLYHDSKYFIRPLWLERYVDSALLRPVVSVSPMDPKVIRGIMTRRRRLPTMAIHGAIDGLPDRLGFGADDYSNMGGASLGSMRPRNREVFSALTGLYISTQREKIALPGLEAVRDNQASGDKTVLFEISHEQMVGMLRRAQRKSRVEREHKLEQEYRDSRSKRQALPPLVDRFSDDALSQDTPASTPSAPIPPPPVSDQSFSSRFESITRSFQARDTSAANTSHTDPPLIDFSLDLPERPLPRMSSEPRPMKVENAETRRGEEEVERAMGEEIGVMTAAERRRGHAEALDEVRREGVAAAAADATTPPASTTAGPGREDPPRFRSHAASETMAPATTGDTSPPPADPSSRVKSAAPQPRPPLSTSAIERLPVSPTPVHVPPEVKSERIETSSVSETSASVPPSVKDESPAPAVVESSPSLSVAEASTEASREPTQPPTGTSSETVTTKLAEPTQTAQSTEEHEPTQPPTASSELLPTQPAETAEAAKLTQEQEMKRTIEELQRTLREQQAMLERALKAGMMSGEVKEEKRALSEKPVVEAKDGKEKEEEKPQSLVGGLFGRLWGRK